MSDKPTTTIIRSLPIEVDIYNPHSLIVRNIHGCTSKITRMRITDLLGRRIRLHVDESGKWADIRVEVE